MNELSLNCTREGVLGGFQIDYKQQQEERLLQQNLEQNVEYKLICDEIFKIKMDLAIKQKRTELERLIKNLKG